MVIRCTTRGKPGAARPGARAAVLALVLALAGPGGPGSGRAAEPPLVVREVALEPADGGLAVAIRTSAAPAYEVHVFDGPWRIVVDIRDAVYRAGRPAGEPRAPVREVRGGQFRKDVARVVIVLDARVPHTTEPTADGLRVVLPPAAPTRPPSVAVTPPAPGPAAVEPSGPPPPPAGATPTAPGGPLPAPAPAAPGPPVVASRPPVTAPAALALLGIVYRGDEYSIAYFLDPVARQVKAYRIGDVVDGKKIEAIEERHVVLRTARGTVVLRLPEPKPTSGSSGAR
ncbi:MAG TPA: AMIN domain-containing protein [Methylomirabilota bacterium]|nr:AMIN domain-containing protein [Methylomirabilota bacterium]